MNTDEVLAHIASATVLRPGDGLVLGFNYRLSPGQAEEIREHVRRAFGETVRVLIVDGSVNLYVLRPGEVAE